MKRLFAAKITLDENQAIRNTEVNGLNDMAPGDYLEHEFKQLEQSGLSISNWLITDYDDESDRARYLNYLIDWVFDHIGEEFTGMSPACYDEWRNNEDTEVEY